MRALLLACLMLATVQSAHADERIFYQPLNSDAQLSPAQWRQIWHDSVKQGAHTLIVQWTAYGDQGFGGADGWLANSLRQAHGQGLKLVVGLAMDAAYYQRINQLDSAGLANYWAAQLGQSLAQQRQVRQHWNLPVEGWYLPMELDDFHFLDGGRREQLQRQLQAFSAKLDAPLHISAFSVGKLSPSVQAQWLAQLAALKIQVWWQDGVGTGRLPALVREGYAAALPCTIGIVHEAFRQTSKPDQPFRAEPAKPASIGSGCHPTAVFELRYRPWGRSLLASQHKAP
ncbi:DUF4434 family protein [Pseudomonas akapageensis]|uniref:DUF4434 family protein n=1 Tax=Pseudomonas akapageensis TaxID=2609961 RepID=UPI00140BE974|nr:DUF4434 family protein [Pseudomonas akapageensis]